VPNEKKKDNTNPTIATCSEVRLLKEGKNKGTIKEEERGLNSIVCKETTFIFRARPYRHLLSSTNHNSTSIPRTSLLILTTID
jgi:hypothetical protein